MCVISKCSKCIVLDVDVVFYSKEQGAHVCWCKFERAFDVPSKHQTCGQCLQNGMAVI